MIVQLGNDQALDRGQPLDGNRITTVDIPTGWSVADVVRSISHADGLWSRHSAADKPVWIEASGAPEVAQALADHYDIPIGRPNGWE